MPHPDRVARSSNGSRSLDAEPDAFRRALAELSLAADAVAEVLRAAIVRCFTESGLRNPELASILVRRSAPRDLATLLGAVFSALEPQANEEQDHLRELLQRAVALDRRYTQLLADHVRGRAEGVGPGAMRRVRRGPLPGLVGEWTEEANALERALKLWCAGQTEAPSSPPSEDADDSASAARKPSERVAARWLDAWNRHDPEAVRAEFANGGAYVDSSLDRELSGAIVSSHVSRIFKEYPDLVFEHIRGEHVDEHTWAGLWALRAGRSGDDATLPTTALDLRVGVFLRIKHDRIEAAQIDFDLAADGVHAAALSEDPAQREFARQQDEQLQERVSAFLETDRAFVDSKLSLARVCERLEVGAPRLSRVLHGATGSGLHGLLIQMRLDEAERLLASPSADTAVLEEIATSVGFKSSSAFRMAFKERTGMTPSRYRRERGSAFEL